MTLRICDKCENISSLIETYIEYIHIWVSNNSLELNNNKSELIIF